MPTAWQARAVQGKQAKFLASCPPESLPVSLQIREATPTDVETLAGFAEAMAWETERKRLDPVVVRRGIAAVFERPGRARYLIAERDGVSAGTLMLTYEWSDWRCAEWWWIQSVYVAETERRHGVFRALYEHVRQAAAATPGICGLRLYVEHDNARAKATYAALGMQASHYDMMEFATPVT